MLKTASLILLALLAAHPGSAAVPQAMTVQGRLLDPASGDPRTDPSADLTFRIFAAASGGTALWTEGPLTVPLRNGLFETEVGASVPLSSAVFLGAARWLEIQVEAEVLAPRQRLSAVPFALRAAAADSLADGDTHYIRTGQDPQAGAVFHVSSGTVAGPVNAYGTLLGAADMRVDGQMRNAGGGALTSAAGLLDASWFDPATTVPNLSLDPSSVTKLGNAVDGPGGLLRLDGSGLVPAAVLDPAAVTQQANSFNGASQLAQLDGGGLLGDTLIDASSVALRDAQGFLPEGLLDASSVTLQSNQFNAAGRLARLDGAGQLVEDHIDVSSVAKLGAGGRLPPSLIDPSSATMQGNSFNAADLLVRLDAAGTLNLPGAGDAQYSLTTSSSVDVTGTGAKVRENGAEVVPKNSILMSIGPCPAGYTEYTALRGRLPLGNCSGCTVGTTNAVAAFAVDSASSTHNHRAGPATGGAFSTGAGETVTTVTDTTMPYLQLRYCQKL